jgi:hypothetical protein
MLVNSKIDCIISIAAATPNAGSVAELAHAREGRTGQIELPKRIGYDEARRENIRFGPYADTVDPAGYDRPQARGGADE